MKLNLDQRSALILKGEPNLTEPRTYIVFGTARGGTTMVAGVMRGFGLDMGPQIEPRNQESAPFMHEIPTEQMRESLREYNEQHQIWGWKNPYAIDYLPEIWSEIRNPHLICVMRDAVANGQGLHRWEDFGATRAVREVLQRQTRNMDMISERDCPSLMISYEKAISEPDFFVEELGQWLGIEVKKARSRFNFRDFMAPGSYKDFDCYRIQRPRRWIHR